MQACLISIYITCARLEFSTQNANLQKGGSGVLHNLAERLPHKMLRLLPILFWIAIWQVICKLVGNELLIPSPISTVMKLGEMLQDERLILNVLYTLARVFVSTLLCIMAGLVTAIISRFSTVFEELIRPIVSLMKVTPVMAIIILAILWVRADWVPIFVGFLMGYPIVYTNLLEGLHNLSTELKEVAQVFDISLYKRIRYIVLPQLKPYIAVTLKLIMTMSWKVVIAAEVLAIPKYAIGYSLMNAKTYLETTEIFAWIIIIVVMSKAYEIVGCKVIDMCLFRNRK